MKLETRGTEVSGKREPVKARRLLARDGEAWANQMRNFGPGLARLAADTIVNVSIA